MALLTLTELRAVVANLLSDGDGILASATVDSYLNEAYLQWKQASDDRPRLLSPSSTGLLYSGGERVMTTTLTQSIRRILRAFPTSGLSSTDATVAGGSANSDAVQDLEWAEPWEIRALQASSTTEGTPTMFSAVRVGTDTDASMGRWEIRTWPVPSTIFYMGLLALIEPAKLSTAGDSPDVAQGEDYALARVAAARIAPTMGYDDGYIGELWKGVPEVMQAALRVQEQSKGPRPRPQENPA